MNYRVSHLEAFRQWREDEDAELSDLVEKVMGEWEPSEAMKAGTAFHKALEHAGPGLTDLLIADGYVFHIECDCDLEIADIREIRASKTYIVDGLPIVVSGQLDAIDGKRIDDHKTTGRFDPDRYLSGYQWRLYLDIFEADVFRWNVFEVVKTADIPDRQDWSVFGSHRLEQHRYPQLADDCQRLVADFARLVRSDAWLSKVESATSLAA